MIERLLAAFAADGTDVGSEELADALWLAASLQLGTATGVAEQQRFTEQPAPEPASITPPPLPERPQPSRPDSQPAMSPGAWLYARNRFEPAKRNEEPAQQQTDEHAGERSNDGSDAGREDRRSRKGVPLRVARASSLDEPLAMMRALKPVGRRATDSFGDQLDETATVERSIQQMMLSPVWCPAEESWLDLTLVVDAHHSMLLWTDLVDELRQVLTSTGVFRHVRTWHLLGTEPGGTPMVAHGRSGTPRPPREVAAPSGNRLILVVSDMVAQGWQGAELQGVLRHWAGHNSAAVLDVLPERLWSRGAVLPALLSLRADRPAGATDTWQHAAATQRSRRARRRARERTTSAHTVVPVVDASPRGLSRLTRLVSGDGRWHRLHCLRLDDPYADRETPAAPTAGARLEGLEAVERFQAKASPTAQQLAAYLAAVPLRLPIMNLVRRSMLPTSENGHLAEVALGGLLKPWGPADNASAPDDLQFDFLPGVRDALLGSQLRDDVATVRELVRYRAGKYIRRNSGRGKEFAATRVTDEDGTGTETVDGDEPPFADMRHTAAPRQGAGDDASTAVGSPPVGKEPHYGAARTRSSSRQVVTRGLPPEPPSIRGETVRGDFDSAVHAAVVRVGPLADERDADDSPPRVMFRGSGFFIAPGWVLTTTDVVNPRGRAARSGERSIGITTASGEHFIGELAGELSGSSHGGRERPPVPNVTLVRVPENAFRGMALWLSDRSALSAPEACMYGYTASPSGGPEELEYVRESGASEVTPDGTIVLREVFVPPGCSGGPVVDMRRGAVIGVNRGWRRRDRVSQALPITELRLLAEASQSGANLLHEVMSAHDRHHWRGSFSAGWNWPRLQWDLSRDEQAESGFTAYERAQLFGCFAELPPPRDPDEVLSLVQWARSVMREPAVRPVIHPPRSWREGVGLLYDVNGGRSWRGRDDERAAVVLYTEQVCRTLAERLLPARLLAPGWLAELRAWVQRAELELEDDLRQKVRDARPDSEARDSFASHTYVVVVEIEADYLGFHPWRVKVMRPDGRSSLIGANESGAFRENLEERIRPVLLDAFSHADTGERLAAVDFVLPRSMFDEPVEQWRPNVPRLGELFSPHTVPLGHRRTVALRDFSVRRGDGIATEPHERWRAVRLGGLTAVPLCAGHGVLESHSTTRYRLSAAPMNAVPVHCGNVGSEQSAAALATAMQIGFPAVLWRRGGEYHEDCAEFQDWAHRLLRSARPDGMAGDLRDLVRQARNRGSEVDAAPGGLGLFYDPPV